MAQSSKTKKLLDIYKDLVQGVSANGNFGDCTKEVLADLQIEENNNQMKDQAAIQHRRGDCSEAFKSEKRVLDIRLRLFGAGVTQHSLGDYISVLEPKKHIRRKLFGEEHSETADSYLSVGATQHPVGDYNSALESKKGALEIRRKLFGEHPLTTNNNHEVRVTQHSLGDYTSALYVTLRRPFCAVFDFFCDSLPAFNDQRTILEISITTLTYYW
ncbi:hypothetical protein ACROYT_G036507 [Oculina patagonica]